MSASDSAAVGGGGGVKSPWLSSPSIGTGLAVGVGKERVVAAADGAAF